MTTKTNIALAELAEKEADSDLLPDMTRAPLGDTAGSVDLKIPKLRKGRSGGRLTQVARPGL